MKTKFPFVHFVGEGIGYDFNIGLNILLAAFTDIDFQVTEITNDQYRLPDTGELNPEVVEIIRNSGVCIKGPTETQTGKGPKSINVSLRQQLDLYVNMRPIKHFPNVWTPVKHPELLDLIIFRENTEDVYMGIEAVAGSGQAEEMVNFLQTHWKVSDLPEDIMNTGIGVKLISKKGSQRIMDFAVKTALETGRIKLGIAHKGNIMKYTEGAFMMWCKEYAKQNFGDNVCFSKEEAGINGKIFIDSVIADNAFEELLLHPGRFDVLVTTNLNGDYLSDAAAAQIGGIPTAAGGNIGDDCAVFEAIGGTGNAIAGQDIANPTAFFLAFAMMLQYKGFHTEADILHEGIAHLFQQGIGTKDMRFETGASEIPLSTTEFSKVLAEYVKERMPEPVILE